MATDRPGARGPAPEGPKRSGERQDDGYFASRGMTEAQPQAGENSWRTTLPGRARERSSRTPARQAHHRTTGRTCPKTDTRERTQRDATDPRPRKEGWTGPGRPTSHRRPPRSRHPTTRSAPQSARHSSPSSPGQDSRPGAGRQPEPTRSPARRRTKHPQLREAGKPRSPEPVGVTQSSQAERPEDLSVCAGSTALWPKAGRAGRPRRLSHTLRPPYIAMW